MLSRYQKENFTLRYQTPFGNLLGQDILVFDVSMCVTLYLQLLECYDSNSDPLCGHLVRTHWVISTFVSFLKLSLYLAPRNKCFINLSLSEVLFGIVIFTFVNRETPPFL